MALVIGEFKISDATTLGRRLWIKHMPDAPLLVAGKTWDRIERVFAPLFEAGDADTGHKVRLIVTALIRARREHTCEIDAASFMLTTEHWIPVEGVHELALLDALASQRRRFIKPLRYDARSTAVFSNAILLDAGAVPVPLQMASPFMEAKERAAKNAAAAGDGRGACSTTAMLAVTAPAGSALRGGVLSRGSFLYVRIEECESR